jgi:N6-L-threonylcarbamoyladenine synthase
VKILAIETSCDETSAAVVSSSPDNRILSNVIHSQIEIHKKYGGVIPEYAARNHLNNIDVVVTEALKIANVRIKDIDVVAATAGPGLMGGLLVGLTIAKTISIMIDKPFIAINHLEAHILTPRLIYTDLDFPYLVLLASGGNFLFAEVKKVGQYKILGETLDDAAGEAFDKVAKMLGLPYPGGPSIEKAASKGNKNRFNYTIPLLKQKGCNGSFSGLKTATKKHIATLRGEMNDQDVCDIAASFQNVVVKFIERQFKKALEMTSSNVKSVVIAGGVAANQNLRTTTQHFAKIHNLQFFAPPIALCSDNAAMIGWCAVERIKANLGYSDLNFPVKPRWQIDNTNAKGKPNSKISI